VNCRPHLLECAAAADVGDGVVDVGVARFRFLPEQGRYCHDHAALAVAALRHVVLQPGLLHRVVLRSLSAFVAIASVVALADRYWLRARGYLRAGLPFKEDGEAEGAENGRAVIARTVRARALSIP
jgi:hypothetical protein